MAGVIVDLAEGLVFHVVRPGDEAIEGQHRPTRSATAARPRESQPGLRGPGGSQSAKGPRVRFSREAVVSPGSRGKCVRRTLAGPGS